MTDLPSLKLLIPYFLCIGALTAYFAHKKRGRAPLPWFFLGFFFGLLGLLSLFLLPKKLPQEPPATLSIELGNKTQHPMKQQLWYFLDATGKQTGPISFFALKAKYAKGEVLKSSYVWNAHLEQWEILNQLTDYPSLFEEQPELS
jgi:hypothetical protein